MVCIKQTNKKAFFKKKDTVDKRFFNKVKAVSRVTGKNINHSKMLLGKCVTI